MSAMRLLLAAVTVLWLSTALADQASRDPQQIRAQLSQLRQRIRALNQTLAEHDRQRDALSDELRNIDRRINDNLRDQHRLSQQQTLEKERLHHLKRAQSDARIELVRHGERLAASLRAAYKLGHGRGLKLVFSSTSPGELGRLLAYYGYFSRARVRQIQATRENMQRLQRIADQIRSRRAALAVLVRDSRRQMTAEQVSRNQRKALLARIDARLREQHRALQQLDNNKNHLQTLLDGLLQVLADIPGDIDSGERFSSLHGKLSWPSAGRLARGGASGKQRSGVLIRARPDAEIHAVAHGRVVFAEWLRGFGLMVIVDHDDGYMSLYAHADTLFKDVGDWVERGEVLGQVGSSGGLGQAALYFEIRHNGAPLSLRHWFAAAQPPGSTR